MRDQDMALCIRLIKLDGTRSQILWIAKFIVFDLRIKTMNYYYTYTILEVMSSQWQGWYW